MTIEDNESATCTITNDDIDYSTAPDISMTKTVNGLVEGCPAIIGEDLSFTITVLNQGPGSIGNIVLDDHWSWQLDATALPDGLDCSQPEMRSLLCNLGSHSPGDSTVIDLDFTVSGNPGEEICNTAVVSTTPLETINTSNNESAVCLSLSGLLELESAVLPPALVANDYNQAIGISGGLQPFSVSLSGLPPGLSWSLDGNQILIQGCPGATGLSVFTAEVENEASCQNTGRAFTLSVESDPECPLSEFSSMAVDEVGTPDSNSGLPDESFQKIAVDEDENRYLVGYVNNAQRNYDIRLIKYSPSGSMLWDKTYDTGSHDLGYAVNVSPDGERVYVGGTTMMVTSNQLWWDAMLLELDASSGCTVGEHFQSAGTATSSTYYDIASNAEAVYAVGEQQVNADKPGGPHQSGGLVSVFSQQSRQLAGSCSDRVSISDSSSDELSWQWTRVREGTSPTVAYSVQLPDVECEGCDILVGGADGANGWVDILNVTSQGLESFLSPSAISVQDMTVPGNDRIIIGGSSTTNAMKILAYDRSGTSVWSQTSLGQGRLRALATDMHGMIYAVGKNMDSQPTGLLFKLNPAGNTIDSRTLTQGGGLSFHDLAVPRPGGGVIGAQARRTDSDFSWQLLEFICGGSCSPGSQIGE